MDVRVGYSGGTTKNPTYEEVCSGKTGHAEVVQIDYNPHVIRYEKLLDIFWESHDPTTLHQQGADIGSQYRSVLFYHSDEQREITEKSIKRTDQSGLYVDPIITAIMPLIAFYSAEDYHQDYYRLNPNAPYCQVVIKPKLDKLKKQIN
jgi:peptide-methionine (S)-S-oxide reductase